MNQELIDAIIVMMAPTLTTAEMAELGLTGSTQQLECEMREEAIKVAQKHRLSLVRAKINGGRD